MKILYAKNQHIVEKLTFYAKIFFAMSEKVCTFAIQNVKKMSKKNKDARVQVILECTEQKASGVSGMSRYITTKNKKNTPGRLELKKYNPYLKKVTVHKEIK